MVNEVALRLAGSLEPATVAKIRGLSPARFAEYREELRRQGSLILLGLFDIVRPELQA